MSGIRPIVYPGGQFRTSAQIAAMNDIHSPERLPEHKEFLVSHPSGDGWDALVAEVVKYNDVTVEEASVWLQRLLLEPGMQAFSTGGGHNFTATVLGIRCRVNFTV